MPTPQLPDYVDRAIQTGGAIRMYYTNNQGNASVRVVEPRRWDNNYVFIAYCHARKEERAFKLSNVFEWQYFDSVQAALVYQENPPDVKEQIATVIPAAVMLPSKAAKNLPAKVLPTPIIQVTNSDEWSRLLIYYKGCLIREHQQQYELDKQNVRRFTLPATSISAFLQAEIILEFQIGSYLQRDPLVDFIQKNQGKGTAQLCFGYPFLALDGDKVFPLLYVPVEVKTDHQTLKLQASGVCEVNYSAFKKLGMQDEEIEAFLEECEQVTPAQGQSIPEALHALMLAKLNGFFPRGLAVVTDQFKPMSIYNGPALFYVTGNIITMNLLHELDELSEVRWENIPASLKQLINILPDHAYPEISKTEPDKNIYVTSVNEQQRRAVRAVENEPVTIITGPPGTGKSQLVLNLIARAFMKGEKVLFASRNNRAVDVVMNRLQNELRFQGSVRTGSGSNRERAAIGMRAALATVATGATPREFLQLVAQYNQAQERSQAAQQALNEIRRLTGLRVSQQEEQKTYLGFLPSALSPVIASNPPAYVAVEIEKLESTLFSFLEMGLTHKATWADIEARLLALEGENTTTSALVNAIKLFEDQWGAFGGGFIRTRKYQNWEHLLSHLQTWLDLITVIELLEQKNSLILQVKDLNQPFAAAAEALPAELSNQIEPFALANQSQVVKAWQKRVEKFYFDALQAELKQDSFWTRLINLLTLGKNQQNKVRLFTSLQDQIQVDTGLPKNSVNIGIKELVSASEKLYKFLAVVSTKQALFELQAKLQNISSELSEKINSLPQVIQNDLGKLPSTDFANDDLRSSLVKIQARALEARSQCSKLAEQINEKLFGNQDSLQVIKEFVDSPAGNEESLWLLSTPVEPEMICDHITKWHNILAFWKANALLTQVDGQLAEYPEEMEAVKNVKTTSADLLALSGEIMRATWLDRAQKASNETIKNTHDYVAAIETLAGKYDPNTYQYYKGIAERNLQYAVQIFPIWATTNLSAKTNFPLSSGFFDVVIIDEASQCDLPSALPLLFRARKIVIIGDPNQLRHVATLAPQADMELSARGGISPDAYSYNRHSLFDIAQRSSGAHPGTLLLNEHYRSDQRIINFSNQEFYSGKLVIKTDLSVRGIAKEFLNEKGGLFWLDVPGQTENNNGSNRNAQELAAIEDLVPMLFDHLKKNNLGNASIGLVTPYRAQDDKLQTWARSRYGSEGQIVTGTAHQFQGDERDFMIFSTVAAPGMGNGSIKWLDKEKNLLNVAVTRARISLIVVGDWNFCMSLPVSHSFRHLADYAQKQGRVANNLKELPFFGKPSFPIVGYVTDPHNPEFNKTTLRRFLSSCNEFIWWTDPFLTNRVFDLFLDIFQDVDIQIKQVLMVTSVEQTMPDKNNHIPLDPAKLARWRVEFGRRGIQFDLRLANKSDIPHDRYLYSQNLSINMPPFNQANGGHGNVSEYTQSNTNKDLFLQVWDKAKAIEE